MKAKRSRRSFIPPPAILSLSMFAFLVCAAAKDSAGHAPPPRPPPASPETGTRFEEDSPAVAYTGAWSPNRLPVHSASGARLSMDAGSKASFAFSGGGVSWIGYRDEWSGIARVSVDGVVKEMVDTFASPARAQATLFTIDGLGRGVHTLTIEATGTHSAASRGSWIWVDSFFVTSDGAEPWRPRNDRR